MLGFDHGFPYSNFHEINLEWLINKMKELECFVKTEMAKQNQKIKELGEKLDKEIEDRKTADAGLQTQITNNYNYLVSRIGTLEEKHRLDMVYVRDEMAQNYVTLKNYIDQEIEKVKRLINAPIPCPTFNYIRQKTVCLQTTLFDYYNFLRPHAFTAGWFDAQGFTCAELDSLGQTAIQWDMFGKCNLRNARKNWPWMVYDHHTGQVVPAAQSLNELWQYHMTGLTCGEWDNMSYTCAEFDAAGYTAKQLDWTKDPAELDKEVTA